jgi:hypothetical protein
MSIFNDKALKGVAEAAAKIMAETSHGTHPKTPKEKSLAALAHPKDKITHKDVLVGRGVLKKEEKEQLDELSKKTLGSYIKKAQSTQINDYQDQADHAGYGEHPERRKGLGRSEKIHRAVDKLVSKKTNEEVEQLQEYESKGGTYQHKGNYGTSYKTDEEGNEIKPAKQKGYGARQNYVRGTSTGEKKKMKESLSFTEMLELYNEHGLKVLAPIEKEEQQIGDQTVEVIDADKVNGVVATAIEEEATEEEFNKELKDQQDSFAGKKKQPKVAAGKTTGVKIMPEEVELDERTLTSGESKKKEEYVKGMKKGLSGFKQRYGERAKSVMYATATSMAKKKS